MSRALMQLHADRQLLTTWHPVKACMVTVLLLLAALHGKMLTSVGREEVVDIGGSVADKLQHGGVGAPHIAQESICSGVHGHSQVLNAGSVDCTIAWTTKSTRQADHTCGLICKKDHWHGVPEVEGAVQSRGGEV